MSVLNTDDAAQGNRDVNIAHFRIGDVVIIVTLLGFAIGWFAAMLFWLGFFQYPYSDEEDIGLIGVFLVQLAFTALPMLWAADKVEDIIYHRQ